MEGWGDGWVESESSSPLFFPPQVFLLQRCFSPPAAGQCSWFGTCGLIVPSLSLSLPLPLAGLAASPSPLTRSLAAGRCRFAASTHFSAQRGPIISPCPPLRHILYTPRHRVCLTDDGCDVEPLKALCGAEQRLKHLIMCLSTILIHVCQLSCTSAINS